MTEFIIIGLIDNSHSKPLILHATLALFLKNILYIL